MRKIYHNISCCFLLCFFSFSIHWKLDLNHLTKFHVLDHFVQIIICNNDLNWPMSSCLDILLFAKTSQPGMLCWVCFYKADLGCHLRQKLKTMFFFWNYCQTWQYIFWTLKSTYQVSSYALKNLYTVTSLKVIQFCFNVIRNML